MAATIRPVGWDVTALPRIGADTPLAADAHRIDPGFALAPRPGYDGQFYWAIAIDPLARGSVHRDVDKPTYRYGHPLLGWVGWLLSGGQAGAAAAALLALGLLSVAAAAAVAAALGGFRASLFVSLNPGLLYAAAHSLAEPLAVALVLGALGTFRARPRLSAALCVLLPLTKEQLLVVPVVLGAAELARRERRGAALYAVAVVPSLIWWTAMRIHLGAWFTTGDTALGVPFTGWRRALLDAGVDAAGGGVGESTVVVLAALVGLLVVTTFVALRHRRAVDVVYIVLAVIAACLAANATVIPRDALRNVALLIAIVPFVLGTVRPWRASPS